MVILPLDDFMLPLRLVFVQLVRGVRARQVYGGGGLSVTRHVLWRRDTIYDTA
jgi:hypothetical protein